MEEEEEDDLEISFKPSSIPTFLPFPPVDSSAHLLNALSTKVGTKVLADLDIRPFTFLLKSPNFFVKATYDMHIVCRFYMYLRQETVFIIWGYRYPSNRMNGYVSGFAT